MGGTFMSLPAEYRDYFIRNLHDALSGTPLPSFSFYLVVFMRLKFNIGKIGHTSNNVEEAVKYSEQSNIKCVGLTIETRPDWCLKRHLSGPIPPHSPIF